MCVHRSLYFHFKTSIQQNRWIIDLQFLNMILSMKKYERPFFGLSCQPLSSSGSEIFFLSFKALLRLPTSDIFQGRIVTTSQFLDKEAQAGVTAVPEALTLTYRENLALVCLQISSVLVGGNSMYHQ